jgi:hypothetical protein
MGGGIISLQVAASVGISRPPPDFSQIPPRERNHEDTGEPHRNASETRRYAPLSGLLNLVH